MALHLITGYAGTEHITSADQGAYNMGTFGDGEFVLNRGSKFAATVVTNNSITIANGEAMMQGRYIKLPIGTSESVSIDNGTSGQKRKDLIVLRYEKNSGTGVETATLAVKKGTPSSDTPSDPSVTTGNITDGTDLVNEMKLYRVNLNGLNIESVDTLFSVKTNMVDYMDNYQMPVATDETLGGVKIYKGLQIDASGNLSVKDATDIEKGGARVYSQAQVNADGTPEYKRVYIDSNGYLQLGKPYVSDDYEGINQLLELDQDLIISPGITTRASVSIYLSQSDSNTLRERLSNLRKNKHTTTSEFYFSPTIYFKKQFSDASPSAYILSGTTIDIPKTGKCYIHTPNVIYNPSSTSVTVGYAAIAI